MGIPAEPGCLWEQGHPTQGPSTHFFTKNELSNIGTNSYFLPRGFVFYGNGSILELVFFFSPTNQKFREISAGGEFAGSLSAVHAIKPIVTTNCSCFLLVF